MRVLFDHDQQKFEKPDGWKGKTMANSPLLTDFCEIWEKNLQFLYLRELPDLAYQEIPTTTAIEENISTILSVVK